MKPTARPGTPASTQLSGTVCGLLEVPGRFYLVKLRVGITGPVSKQRIRLLSDPVRLGTASFTTVCN